MIVSKSGQIELVHENRSFFATLCEGGTHNGRIPGIGKLSFLSQSAHLGEKATLATFLLRVWGLTTPMLGDP